MSKLSNTFFYREKFLLGKKCRFHCSWKVVALALTAVTLILSTVIAYFGGKEPTAHLQSEERLENFLNVNVQVMWTEPVNILVILQHPK